MLNTLELTYYGGFISVKLGANFSIIAKQSPTNLM